MMYNFVIVLKIVDTTKEVASSRDKPKPNITDPWPVYY